MGAIFTNIAEIFANSGWAQIFFAEGGWKYAVMIGVACVLLYLAIVHQFEPLLLLPIGFGMLMTNLPLDGIFHMDIFINETQHINWELLGTSGGKAHRLHHRAPEPGRLRLRRHADERTPVQQQNAGHLHHCGRRAHLHGGINNGAEHRPRLKKL